ncbi:MAG TPA: type II toxin-antitoxin system prevent-host-death family antitoxin [Rhizomicrobium sp.]|nr:type II toxin-antitoxin system prevent-host-death family antitoxin [Rhizomicrobium sp.]
MAHRVWSVSDAKTKLSEILRRARVGEAQVIGTQDPCVVLSMTDFADLERKAGQVHLGRWLVEHTPKVEFEAPERKARDRNLFKG